MLVVSYVQLIVSCVKLDVSHVKLVVRDVKLVVRDVKLAVSCVKLDVSYVQLVVSYVVINSITVYDIYGNTLCLSMHDPVPMIMQTFGHSPLVAVPSRTSPITSAPVVFLKYYFGSSCVPEILLRLQLCS